MTLLILLPLIILMVLPWLQFIRRDGTSSFTLLELSSFELFIAIIELFLLMILLTSDNSFTYEEFNLEVNRVALGLLELGLRKGDRVGIWSPNNVEWALTQFATAKIGVILVREVTGLEPFLISGLSRVALISCKKSSSIMHTFRIYFLFIYFLSFSIIGQYQSCVSFIRASSCIETFWLHSSRYGNEMEKKKVGYDIEKKQNMIGKFFLGTRIQEEFLCGHSEKYRT